MEKNSKELKDSVAIIGIGATHASFGIVARLLQQGATVVVPLQSSHHLEPLQQYLADYNTDKLVTFLTDLPDYDKAVALAECIIDEYGRLDIAVFPFDYLSVNASLSDISIEQWQRAVEENLAVYFICCRAVINAMKKKGDGMFIALIDADGLSQQSGNAMTDMLMTGQVKMARSFFEEVSNTGVKFHHLFIENLVTPDMIGWYILALHNDERKSGTSPFLFYMGKNPDSN